MNQRARKQECDRLIFQNAENIYNLLWKEMTKWIEEAQQRGIDVWTNGSPYERQVGFKSVIAEQRQLTLALDKERQTIAIGGPRLFFVLQLAVCSDNTVCLKHDGKEIQIGDAAIKILDPFLFPEFAPVS